MKKQLLLGAFLMGSFLTGNAQNSCDDAVAVTADDTYTVSSIGGDYEIVCVLTNEQADAAAWYSFTATETGLLTISSAIDANDAGSTGTDTRLSVYTGDCDNLECYGSNDDQVVTAGSEDYRSIVTVAVEVGQTYYFIWDNNWQNTAFDFEVSFEAVSCFAVSAGFMFTEAPSPTSVTIGWNAPIGEPESYDVIWGEPGFDPVTEGTLIAGLENPEVEISGLMAESNYEFYVYTNCSGGENAGVGPIAFSTLPEPGSLPYENGFEDVDNFADGISSEGWTFATNDMIDDDPFSNYAQDGDGFAFTSTQAESWMFKGVNSTANQTITVTFYASYLGDADDDATIAVTSGTEAWAASQTEVESFAVAGGAAGAYQMFTAEFDVDDAGVYYVGFHNLAGTVGGFSLLVDSIEITSATAGINDVLASKFSIFPNPATNMIGFANADNILVNGVVITDLNGRTVKTVNYAGVNEAQINVSDLATGMYMMTVSSDQGTMSKKIVKN